MEEKATDVTQEGNMWERNAGQLLWMLSRAAKRRLAFLLVCPSSMTLARQEGCPPALLS